jgi:deoxyhypusine synthase
MRLYLYALSLFCTHTHVERLRAMCVRVQNDIPVYCPALTDGSIGDMIFFHSFNKPGLVVDLVSDIRGINLMAMVRTDTAQRHTRT